LLASYGVNPKAPVTSPEVRAAVDNKPEALVWTIPAEFKFAKVIGAPPTLLRFIALALPVPKFKAAGLVVPASIVNAPFVVDQVEAEPAVNVKPFAEVKLDDPIGVKLTEPTPEAVKLPSLRVRAISVEPTVDIVAPLP
jgi:hypothetical protein